MSTATKRDVLMWARLIVQSDRWPAHSEREDVVVLPRRFVRELATAAVRSHARLTRGTE